MKKGFFELFKIIGGIYLISSLTWIPFLYISDGIFIVDTLKVSFFIIFNLIIVLFGSAIFYSFTKNKFLIEEQITYVLIALMLMYDIFYLKSTMDHTDDNGALVFALSFNLLSVFYIVKNENS
ncbi:hypothetical protein IRZ71_06815 [Flavobacterium sp. ANB]|uniref:hypothetical protein n=1 Tax=unclassified Flavobacterium TaxID=196869 RepID=UPI0012B9911B|nr:MULTISPECIES: hypothetical protein [unclassified Flavobacterium]MBF4516045.1 hypothetical protein [Flavobacterium sp. ANB]MTD69047.1 hypothetical protein [Flavobacterium sp. LC2016-13]